MTTTSDDEVLGGGPGIEGARTGGRHVAGKVVDGGYSPGYVADQLDVSLAAVSEAMAYYDENIEEIRAFERENAVGFERVFDSLKPKKSVS